MISRDSSVFIIGGLCDGLATSRIAKYTGDTWSLAGNLQADRHAHRAIMNGDRVYVVGGFNGPL